MHVRKLDNLFYEENTHLVEVLDKAAGQWVEEKVRGYGIVVIEFRGLKFGIPLRSNLRSRKHCFVTAKTVREIKGLDYGKAVLLSKEDYVSDAIFQIPPAEFKKLRDGSFHISQQFGKYVERYVQLSIEEPQSTVLTREYRFSTLVNYRVELGIEQPVQALPAA
ncbi:MULTISPECIES: type III toxin-antitoxin system TenpIN family toxin [Pseudomonas]|uniref:type III toxin-antitoxin system TenpIN family toxin n=1 Tax=Pseudomonas TaxID=286 RepID=UPI00057936B6|nr:MULTISPECIES: hypothetical protein [Pseudomonas putida group]MCL8300879.1 hypothetical protein [Pseudomonas mosselii]MCL8341225.1 hypothetical protein [Pseudomonas mosselii]WJR28450.1 hypothetical protein LU678_029675 [Pseudomonas mosselii]